MVQECCADNAAIEIAGVGLLGREALAERPSRTDFGNLARPFLRPPPGPGRLPRRVIPAAAYG
jgi:hypothetical protein